ncbi:MAG TPA: galactokinase [Thermoanaerobaculia bacterium]|nr:galactokinase [Thermoanaerobaculia bacterium]
MRASHRQRFGAEPAFLVRAPGRVNLLGGHVDYSEGWVLPCAVTPALWLAASPRPGRRLALHLPDLGFGGELELDRLPPPVPERVDRAESPADLAAGVCWSLAELSLEVPGAALSVRSTIPIGAGMSSSAAFEVAFALALTRLAGRALGGLDLARVGRACENAYLGLGSGIMDQYVCVFGEADRALLLDCRTLTHRAVALPATVQLLVADSGVRRRLVASSYGDRAAECARALALLRRDRPGLATLRDLPPGELEAAVAELPTPLDRRVRHVVTECARVLRGAAALERGDLAELAAILRAAHESLRDDFEVTVPELDLLAETAWGAPGCRGARAFGGGFGGCVVALVDDGAVAELSAQLTQRFTAAFGREPALLVSRAGAGASVVDGAAPP